MVRVKTSLMIFGFVFILIACLQKPVASTSMETPTPIASTTPVVAESNLASATPWVEGTELALASPTPWLAGTETAVAAATAETQDVLPTIPPPSQQKPMDFSPVLYGGKVYQTTFFLLLGGVSRETWLVPDTSVARFSGEVTYSLHSFGQEAKYFLWGKSPEFSQTCKTYFVGTEAALDESGFVGVVDGWSVTKRPATEVSAELYQQVVIDWLRDEGAPAPEVDSLHVYRVDLEGDGTDEVFISATHLDDSQHTTKAGDYSIILMRQVVGNDTLTKLVVGDIYRSQEPEITFPRTYSLTNFIDLNQDGTLEVVVETQKWEGFGARVFQIDDGDVIEALSAEC